MITHNNTGNRLLAGAIFATTLGAGILAPSPADAAPSTTADAIRTLQIDANQDLVPLGMPRLAVDGKLGAQTLRAACAENWLTTGVATRSTAAYTTTKINELNNKDNMLNPYMSEHRTRIANGFIVNKTCQVMADTKNNRVIGLYPISTGIAGNETPNVLSKIFLARRGWHNSTKYPAEDGTNGNMNNPLYFYAGGIAIHGSRAMSSSSTTPKSHGCVRVTPEVSEKLFRKVRGNVNARQDAIVRVDPLPVAVIGKFGN